MEVKDYIELGILEFYVYGLLSEFENIEVVNMVKNNFEINNEIIFIEKVIVVLFFSFLFFYFVVNYEKIKVKFELKYGKIIEMKLVFCWLEYIGWVVVVLLFLGIGY